MTHRNHDPINETLAMSELDKQLLNEFQRDFPLTSTPYADIAARIGVTEQEVIARLRQLRAAGVVGRVGAVIRPHSIGTSVLAAMAVPAARLEQVAALVNGYPEVNHNYEREHRYNLWFVVTAADQDDIDAVLNDIQRRTGIRVLALPMLESYHIDVGFKLHWEPDDRDIGEINANHQ